MTGQFERLLEGISSAPRYNVHSAFDSTARTLDKTEQTWKDASARPGWQGVSAQAASNQFTRHSSNIAINARILRSARDIIVEANAILDDAATKLSELPDATIDERIKTNLQSGLSVLIPGFGTISNAFEFMTFGRELTGRRESAAKEAYRNIENKLNNLAYELTGLNGNAIVTVGNSQDPKKKPSLEDILKEYQVRDDPDGMIKWTPSGFNAWIADRLGEKIDPQDMTSFEGFLLDGLRPWDLKDFRDIHDNAFSEATSKFPLRSDPTGLAGNDDHTDAFRHAYWNALMTKRYGIEWASTYATAHEGIPGNQAPREAMDLYNNQIGRDIATANPWASEEELARKVQEAVSRGDMVVVTKDGKLGWSDLGINDVGHPDENFTLDGNPAGKFLQRGTTS